MKIFDVEINDEIYYSVKEVFNIFLLDDRIKEFYFVNFLNEKSLFSFLEKNGYPILGL